MPVRGGIVSAAAREVLSQAEVEACEAEWGTEESMSKDWINQLTAGGWWDVARQENGAWVYLGRMEAAWESMTGTSSDFDGFTNRWLSSRWVIPGCEDGRYIFRGPFEEPNFPDLKALARKVLRDRELDSGEHRERSEREQQRVSDLTYDPKLLEVGLTVIDAIKVMYTYEEIFEGPNPGAKKMRVGFGRGFDVTFEPMGE